ncbi:MerR family transcriptional regulator [uncultured Corynebacterium sp.]|uniref:MerR family transcriptional regulator n=1 Tax=uncultured Corynebacterium sp. TaxID=159447 RepID=UPI002597B36C|nr:MerR family transcriptional regulator [uncultured Corynebacterium sp.]
MRISDVARAAGCSARAIRHYHESGALPEPSRTSNGYRDYSLRDLANVLRVRALVEAGIPLSSIKCGKTSLFDDALTRIDHRIADLQAQRDRLIALRAGDVGVPADIRHHLVELLRETDICNAQLESLELMGLTGVAAGETWKVLRRNLRDDDLRAEELRAAELWELLAETKPQEADAIIAELASLRGIMQGIHDTLAPGALPISAQDVPAQGAQLRALDELSR